MNDNEMTPVHHTREIGSGVLATVAVLLVYMMMTRLQRVIRRRWPMGGTGL